MSAVIYRCCFEGRVPVEKIEAVLVLATMGVESLHGASQARLDASHCLDVEHRTCVIDASTPAGRDLARLFTGYALCEFGEDGFRIQRVRLRSDALDAESNRNGQAGAGDA